METNEKILLILGFCAEKEKNHSFRRTLKQFVLHVIIFVITVLFGFIPCAKLIWENIDDLSVYVLAITQIFGSFTIIVLYFTFHVKKDTVRNIIDDLAEFTNKCKK